MTVEASDLNARISKLEFQEGDVMVVLVPHVLTIEKRLLYAQVMRAAMPPGVKCLVLDAGTTIEKLKREHEAEIDCATYRETFGDKVETLTVSLWQRVRNWVKAL